MCQRKPGPRCSGHLGQQIIDAEKQVAENRSAWRSNVPLPYPGAESRLEALRDEYDETSAGQARLAEQITAAAVCDADTRQALVARKAAAANRHEVKLAALAASEAGDERAAKIIARTGIPNSGWLSYSRLNLLNAGCAQRMAIAPDGSCMVGVLTTDTEINHDRLASGHRETASLHHVVLETPIGPGPTEGTYYTAVDRDGHPTDASCVYTEADLDHPNPTLRQGPAERSLGDLVPAASLDKITGYASAVHYRVEWEEDVEIIRDPAGRPVLLRGYGTVATHHDDQRVARQRAADRRLAG